MAKLTELVREHTTLDREQISHLNRLVSEWGMLSDFCFSDLLLYVPGSDRRWAVVAQVRPATGQTMYQTDWVGTWASDSEVAYIDRAHQTGDVVEGEITVEGISDETRIIAIPVVHEGRRIAVLTREWIEKAGRRPGELERAYGSVFQSFVRMIADGSFPFPHLAGDSSSAPRVGDGVLWLNSDAEVQYVSPNANSALHRVGIQASAIGMRLAELGFHDGPVRQAFERQVPVIEEFEQGDGVTLLCRCVPFVHDGEVSGAVLLMRDVTARPAAAEQGRDDPRDPPPGQEQPADHLVVATPAGAAAHAPRGDRRRR
jgi:two-component system, sensor histidine kinase PdtaS